MKISEELEDLLDKCHIEYDLNYTANFTHVARAIQDPNRLSCINNNALESASKAYVNPSQALACLMEMPPSSKFRQAKGTFIKPGKFLQVIASDYTEQQAHTLTTMLRQTSSHNSCTNLQISSTPSKVYVKYSSNFYSCMMGKDKSFFELYDLLPNTSILYLLNEDEDLIGKALLHDSVRVITDGETKSYINMMDRIYSADANIEAMFKNWAHTNGYYHKLDQGVHKHKYSHPVTYNIQEFKVVIDLPEDFPGEFENVPYMDTFCYYFEELKLLSSAHSIFVHGKIFYSDSTLHETYGNDDNYILTPEHESGIRCTACDCNLMDDNTYYAFDYAYCDRCYDDRFTTCNLCENIIEIDDSTYIESIEETVCSDCLNNNYTECDHCNDYFKTTGRNSSTMYNTYDEDSICEHCYEQYYFCCEECENIFSEREMQSVDQLILCESCANDRKTEAEAEAEVDKIFDFSNKTDYDRFLQVFNLEDDYVTEGRFKAMQITPVTWFYGLTQQQRLTVLNSN
jgi:hypothetical protein